MRRQSIGSMLGALALGALGCTAPDGAIGSSSAALEAPVGVELVIERVTWMAPEGGDGESHLSVVWADGLGRRQAIDVGGAIVDAIEWRGGAAVRTADGRLFAVRVDGSSTLLANGAAGALATSDDGVLLAWARELPDGLGEVHVNDGRRDVVVARDLQSAGTFRFSADGRVLGFVGAAPGGVAGVWAVSIDPIEPPRQLTNAGLRAGRSWGTAFQPPPLRASEIDLAMLGRVR